MRDRGHRGERQRRRLDGQRRRRAGIGRLDRTYAEGTCGFDPSQSYACYKIPTMPDATCPAPTASSACSIATCVVCGGTTGYLDSKGNMKTGYCICQASGKWSCASTTEWPCPNGPGC